MLNQSDYKKRNTHRPTWEMVSAAIPKYGGLGKTGGDGNSLERR